MKISTPLLTVLFLFAFQLAHSQKPEGIHSFKITGKTRVPSLGKTEGEMVVDYDSISPDHLIISEFRKNGFLKTKTRLLFKGGKFNLDNLAEYSDNGKLLVDGIQADYREDQTVASEQLYKEEKLQQKTFYYPNGIKQMVICGNEKILNGEYKIWHSNGQLIFSGNYKNNLKDGEFQQFDETGVPVKKGVYSGGKLISGEAVVQDITFVTPDHPAKYGDGDYAFNDYIRMKTSELKIVKDIGKGIVYSISMNMTISKTGSIEKIDIYGRSNPSDSEILNAAFGDIKGFLPATVEDIPVSSILTLNLIYTTEGLQTKFGSEIPPDIEKSDSLMGPPVTVVEEVPDFPGGEKALQNFLSANVRYPMEAAENGIKGKVFVKFVIEANGSISNIRVAKSVHPLLDAEAVRVFRKMPRWRPGRQDGKPVRISYTVPINFSTE